MKKRYLLRFSLMATIAIIAFSCTPNKSDNKVISDNNTTDTIPSKLDPPEPDVKETIKTIADKYYIPTDNEKSDLIFTINQNLNLQLLNYKGNYEGKVVENKIQFDDSKETTLAFAINDSILELKNENDITIEFRKADDNDLIIGKWYFSGGAVNWPIVISKDGTYKVPSGYLNSGMGKYINKGDGKFTVTNFGQWKSTLHLTLNSPEKLTTSTGAENQVSKRTKNKKIESLNTIFN